MASVSRSRLVVAVVVVHIAARRPRSSICSSIYLHTTRRSSFNYYHYHCLVSFQIFTSQPFIHPSIQPLDGLDVMLSCSQLNLILILVAGPRDECFLAPPVARCSRARQTLSRLLRARPPPREHHQRRGRSAKESLGLKKYLELTNFLAKDAIV